MPRHCLLALTVLTLACGEPANPQGGDRDAGADAGSTPTWDDLDDMLQPLRERHGLPGMSGAVLRGGEVRAGETIRVQPGGADGA